MTDLIAEDLAARFLRARGARPQLFRAPGRVNLIGEHTDYNDGFVLPAALGLGTVVAVAPRSDRLLRMESAAFSGVAEFDLDAPAPRPRGEWTDYVRGVAVVLERMGNRLTGADLMIASDLPMGAGLSASASLEVATGLALAAVSDIAIDATALALLCQRAENEFVGARCGVMDQFVSCNARKGCALLLDCRSLDFRAIPVDPQATLVVCDTMVRHSIAAGEYNLRREQCEAAAATLAGVLDGVTALRDVTREQLDEHASLLAETVFRRARHVVSENARTLAAARALESGDLAECGRLMNASHESLRDDFDVSCAELDLLVDAARRLPGVYGARMMGGGFGGCTINLVEAEAADNFAESVAETFRRATGATPPVFRCSPGPGAGRVLLREDAR